MGAYALDHDNEEHEDYASSESPLNMNAATKPSAKHVLLGLCLGSLMPSSCCRTALPQAMSRGAPLMNPVRTTRRHPALAFIMKCFPQRHTLHQKRGACARRESDVHLKYVHRHSSSTAR